MEMNSERQSICFSLVPHEETILWTTTFKGQGMKWSTEWSMKWSTEWDIE